MPSGKSWAKGPATCTQVASHVAVDGESLPTHTCCCVPGDLLQPGARHRPQRLGGRRRLRGDRDPSVETDVFLGLARGMAEQPGTGWPGPKHSCCLFHSALCVSGFSCSSVVCSCIASRAPSRGARFLKKLRVQSNFQLEAAKVRLTLKKKRSTEVYDTDYDVVWASALAGPLCWISAIAAGATSVVHCHCMFRQPCSRNSAPGHVPSSEERRL